MLTAPNAPNAPEQGFNGAAARELRMRDDANARRGAQGLQWGRSS